MTIYQTQSLKTHQPYLYIIGWTSLDRWYLGIQYGKNAHPSNLWKCYFTSSSIVKKFRQEHGEPDYFEVTEMSVDEAISKEIELLKEYDVLNNDQWLNANIGGAIAYTPEVIRKMSNANKGKTLSIETRQKISNARKGIKLPPVSDATREKLREIAKARTNFQNTYHSPETRQKISNARKNMTEETRQKMCLANKNKPKVTCPYCQKTGGIVGMKRYHFQNCKNYF